MQILSSEERNLQENKTKTVQRTASGTAGIFSLPENEQTAVCAALLKREVANEPSRSKDLL